jgi:hypothetical protein
MTVTVQVTTTSRGENISGLNTSCEAHGHVGQPTWIKPGADTAGGGKTMVLTVVKGRMPGFVNE